MSAKGGGDKTLVRYEKVFFFVGENARLFLKFPDSITDI